MSNLLFGQHNYYQCTQFQFFFKGHIFGYNYDKLHKPQENFQITKMYCILERTDSLNIYYLCIIFLVEMICVHASAQSATTGSVA